MTERITITPRTVDAQEVASIVSLGAARPRPGGVGAVPGRVCRRWRARAALAARSMRRLRCPA